MEHFLTFHSYCPIGTLKAVLYLSFSEMWICQNPDFISNFENILAFEILCIKSDLFGIGYLKHSKTLFKGLQFITGHGTPRSVRIAQQRTRSIQMITKKMIEKVARRTLAKSIFVLMTSGMYNNREYREQKSTFSKLYRTRYIYDIVYYIQLYQIQPSTIYSYLPYIALPDIASLYIALPYIALLNIALPDITVDQAINKYQSL